MNNTHDELVSVIFMTENGNNDQILAVLKNIREQTHKNIDLIISAFRTDIEELQDKTSKLFLNARWIIQKPDINFINDLLKNTDGKYIFYKTLNNILWYPRHIQAHLEQFYSDPKTKWALSHVEYRNIQNANHPLSVLGFRIDNPPAVEKISIDEITHESSIIVNWGECLKKDKNGQPLFYAGTVLKQWNASKIRGTIPAEISVIEWIHSGGKAALTNPEEIFKQVGVPANTEIKENTALTDDGDIEINRVFPTIVGNKFLDEYTNQIRHVLAQTTNIKSIGLKRSIGMGDVVLCEPIIKKLKQKYPQAKLTFYTAKPDIVKYFVNKPDEIVKIDEQQLLNDFLATTDNQVKFDLDLAYESRLMKPFIDSYAEVCNIKFENFRDKYPQLEYKTEDNFVPITPNTVVVCGDGSGWPGKTWPIEKWTKVIEYLHSKGYAVIETGHYCTELTDKQYHNCSLDQMIRLIAGCQFFIGGDNGPAHCASAFNKPRILIAGAALPYYANPQREQVYYIQNNLSESLGIKHKQFFNLMGDRLTFVPHDEKDPTCGLKDIQAEHVISAIEKFLAKEKCVIDNSEMKFYFNIPGWSYYKSEESEIIQREKLEKHPDQDTDISTQYDGWQDNYEKFAKPWIERIAKYAPPILSENPLVKRNLLDVGSSIGLTVKAAKELGYVACGIDINEPSIKKSRELFPEDCYTNLGSIEEILSHQNYSKFDIITSDQVAEHISTPLEWLLNMKKLLNDDGYIFLGTPRFDSRDGEEHFQRWSQAGAGEHTFLFIKKSIDYLMNAVGLNYEELNDSYEYGGFLLCCTKKK